MEGEYFVNQFLRRLAQNAGGFAVGVQINRSALRWLSLAGNAGRRQRGRVGDADVAVDPVEISRMAASDLVEFLTCRQHLLRPQRMVPVPAGEPVAGGRIRGE